MPKGHYSVGEMESLTGLDRATIYRAVDRGRIPGLRVGDRSVIFPKAAVDSWLGMPGWLVANTLRFLQGGGEADQFSTENRQAALMGCDHIQRILDDVRRQLEFLEPQVRMLK